MNNATTLTNHNHYTNNISALELFYEALAKHGIPSPKHIKCDGFSRWGKNNRYWAVSCYDGYCFGDYSTKLTAKVFPNKKYSKQEFLVRRKGISSALAEAKQIQEEQRMEASRLAFEICEAANPITEDRFPYLKKKGVFSRGLRSISNEKLIEIGFNVRPAFGSGFADNVSEDGLIILPLINSNGIISSIQFINNSDKRFLPNGCKKGRYYPIGRLNKRIFLVEGYASGASINMAT